MLATIAGGLMLAVLASARRRSGPRHAGGYVTALLIAMILGATLGVVVRGVLLPEGFVGEKSLLFRWHYLQAASEIVNAHALAGVGPGGFQQAYTLHRPLRNPEEVQSAHAMFTDWLATLGMLGCAWVALIVVLAARAGQSLITSINPDADGAAALRLAVRFALCVAALALAPAMFIEWQALTPTDVFVRGLALAGYLAAAAMIAAVLVRCDDRWLRSVSIAGATVLLAHGQIEMTFFQHGPVVWCMAMVGLIADARPTRSRGFNNAIGAIAMLTIIGWLGWLTWAGTLPALRQERLMLDAARLLDQVRNEPQNHEVILTQRPQAAKKLLEAYEAWPINVRPLNAAAEQLFIAAAPLPPPASATAPTSARPADRSAGVALGLMADAADLIDRAVIEHNDPSSLALARTIHATLAMLTDDTEHWAAALLVSQRLADGDPHGVQPWVRLGDVLWQAGERKEAKQAYQRALQNSDNFDLDELKQLSPRMREMLERRIEKAGE
jgi:tetratricopeptide (TPR) repeat protein